MHRISTAALACAASATLLAAPAAAQQPATPQAAAPPAASGATTPPLPPVVVEQQKQLAPPAAVVAKPKPKPAPATVVDDTPAPKPKAKPAKAVAKSAPTAISTPKPAAVVAEPDAVPPAGQPDQPTTIGVGGEGLAVPASSTTIGATQLDAERIASNDTAAALRGAPGVSIYQAGGVSGLPVINGLADDRVRILLNGMAVSSACANHMNPPLSYSDPGLAGAIEVTGGVAPVSKGGDSIAGTIIVEPALPRFAGAGQAVMASGSASVIYRSNMHGLASSGHAEAATGNVSVAYDGAWSRGDNYRDGNGDQVKSSEYEAQNHTVRLAVRNGGDLLIVQGGMQFIPYQGFVNQRMDMVDNQSWFLNSRYVGKFGWGKLDVRAFYSHVDHEMNFLADKKFNKAPPYRHMPMLTEGADAGYNIKAEMPLGRSDVVRIGNELHLQSLDDWWPATMGPNTMMGGNTYITLNGAERNRVGTFLEWEHKWDRAWSTLLGARNDVVWMNTGNVQGYNNCLPGGGMGCVYKQDADRFNARDHARTDINFDVTALARYEPTAGTRVEMGYAMKTRSPNLYERYAWSRVDGPMDNAQMAMNMFGWFGDGNGYVGNLDLKPERAHTASVTVGFEGGASKQWAFGVTPYYTYVEDFIGVRKIADSIGHPGFVDLEFTNHDARIYGVNVSGRMPLYDGSQFGAFALTGVVGYVHGENADTGVSLYHMMPLNGRFALTHRLGGWSSTVELDLVAGKHNVDTVRNELQTGGYALLNLRTSYELANWRFDLGVENVFDTYYEHPLGGHYIEPTMPGHLGGVLPKGNVPGMGRSINAGVTVKF